MRIAGAAFVAGSFSYGLKASEVSAVPSYLRKYSELYAKDPKAAALAWFKEAKFGLFMHYGLYALLGRGEWVMYREAIPVAEYEKLKEQFKAEIARWAADMKVNPTQIRIQRMTKKWASCSSKGRVCFSSDLLQAPRAFQEYVIVHELLHLQVPNHGKLFKSLMSAYLPGWEMVVAARNGSTVRDL